MKKVRCRPHDGSTCCNDADEVVLLYVCAQFVADFTVKRMYFSRTFLPELVTYIVFILAYIFALRSFREERYFGGAVAGAIIGVTLSICFVRYSFLVMIRLLRSSCAPAGRDTSNGVCAAPFERTAPIGHVETGRSIEQSHRRTYQGPEGPRETVAQPTTRWKSMHPFRPPPGHETFRCSLQDSSGCLYSSLRSFRNGQCTGRTFVRSSGLLFRPGQERPVRNGTSRNNRDS